MARKSETDGLKVINNGKTELRIGRINNMNTCMVIPFRLPDHGSASSPFSNATLTVNLHSIEAGTDFDIDLYGMDARSSTSILEGDFYFGLSDDTSSNATKLQSQLLTTGTAPGFITSVDISSWLNTQYAGGANAGRYVFLRFTPRASTVFIDTINGYIVESANTANPMYRPVIHYDLDSSGFIHHTVTVTHGPNGTVSPSGSVLVSDGSSYFFNLIPEPYYHAEEVFVDGTPAPFSSLFALNNVTADTTVHVNFGVSRNFMGVPDWWIAESNPYWTNNLTRELTGDFDYDGQPTWMEYHAGTDATNPASFFALGIAQQPGATEVFFDTVPMDARDQAAGYPDTATETSGFFRGQVRVIDENGSVVRQPNIILILTDDQGWGDAGFIGHPYMQTPNLDRLAREGTVFKQFYVSAPVCSPSRVGFLSGNFPARHNVNAAFRTSHSVNYNEWKQVDYLDPSTTLVTRMLQTNGYAVAHFGKWHLGGTPGAPKPSAYGIDADLTMNSKGPKLYSSDYYDPNPFDSFYYDTFGTDNTYKHAYSTHAIAYESMRFIEEHQNEPFYLNFFTLLPHSSLNPSPDQLALYNGLTVNVNDFSDWMKPWLQTVGTSTRNAHMKSYCAAMTALDEAIGQLLDKLDELGLAEDTFIFFASDNGPDTLLGNNTAMTGAGSTGPFRSRKRGLYEGGIRTLAIARWPGRIPAWRVDETSVLTAVDWLPTVLSLAGIPMPEMTLSADGEDRSAALLAPAPRTRPIFWERRADINGMPSDVIAIYGNSLPLCMREGDWKLFINNAGSRAELYNIVSDPEERSNLASNYPDIVNSMKADLRAWKASLPPLP
jgi:arylsulfatase A-like enzyme